MVQQRLACLLALTGLLSGLPAAQEPLTPWRDDPLFQRLAAVLDPVLAIDNHTHLLRPGKFDPALAAQVPLMLRSTHPWLSSILKARSVSAHSPLTRRRAWKRSRPRVQRWSSGLASTATG